MTILHVAIGVGLVITHGVAYFAGAKHFSSAAKIATAVTAVVADAKKA